MADNVIWGTDFKAKLEGLFEAAKTAGPDLSHAPTARLFGPDADTSPSEYTAPDGDCA